MRSMLAQSEPAWNSDWSQRRVKGEIAGGDCSDLEKMKALGLHRLERQVVCAQSMPAAAN